MTVKAILDELRKAVKNRNAHAAIAVYSRADHAPVPDPFTVFDDLAIVVYDKDNPDPAALRLACAWARWIVQRDARGADEGFDAEAVSKAVEEARQALCRGTMIRRAHAAATRRSTRQPRRSTNSTTT